MAFLNRILCCAAAFALFLGLFSAAPRAANLNLYEPEIKAGMLYNFLKYTEWPESGETVSLCLFGGDSFDGYLDRTNGRTVNQKQIVLRTVGSASEAASCNLLFVGSGERGRWPEIHAALKGKGVLTVGDFGGFTDSGGMIEFGRSGDHINVLLNVDAVKAARLQVQGRLLRLVTVVHGKGGAP